MDTGLNLLVTGHGVIEVAGLAITLTPLSLEQEMILGRELRRRAEEYYGSPYQRVKNMLGEMPEADRLIVLQEVARCALKKEPLSIESLEEFSMNNPEWVAYEIYQRGKHATPGLTLEGIRALINPANVYEIALQLRKNTLLTDQNDKKSASAANC